MSVEQNVSEGMSLRDWFNVLIILVGGSVLAVIFIMTILYAIGLLNGVAP